MTAPKRWTSQGFERFAGSQARGEQNLLGQFAALLSEKFPEAVQSNVTLGIGNADLIIQRPGRVIVAEFKTGDPELPLPSSTIRQMEIFVEQAHERYPGSEITPVVITNYDVSESDKQTYEREGVKIVSVAPRRSMGALVSDFAEKTGIQIENEAEA